MSLRRGERGTGDEEGDASEDVGDRLGPMTEGVRRSRSAMGRRRAAPSPASERRGGRGLVGGAGMIAVPLPSPSAATTCGKWW